MTLMLEVISWLNMKNRRKNYSYKNETNELPQSKEKKKILCRKGNGQQSEKITMG